MGNSAWSVVPLLSSAFLDPNTKPYAKIWYCYQQLSTIPNMQPLASLG